MKTLKLVVGIALFSVIIWSCKNETKPEIKTVEIAETKAVNEIDANATLAKAEFTIEGMTCAIGCAKTIEKKLSKMEGVKTASVDFDKKLALVEYDEAKVTPESLEETVINTSDKYTVSDMKTVESFSSNFAKKECTIENCDHKGKDCEKGYKKSNDRKGKGDKASMEASNGGKMMGCKDDCKKACCSEKA